MKRKTHVSIAMALPIVALLAWAVACERPDITPSDTIPTSDTLVTDTLPADEGCHCDDPLNKLRWLKAIADQYDNDTTIHMRIFESYSFQSGQWYTPDAIPSGYIVMKYTNHPIFSIDHDTYTPIYCDGFEAYYYNCDGEMISELLPMQQGPSIYVHFVYKGSTNGEEPGDYYMAIYQNYPHRTGSDFCNLPDPYNDNDWVKNYYVSTRDSAVFEDSTHTTITYYNGAEVYKCQYQTKPEAPFELAGQGYRVLYGMETYLYDCLLTA